MAKQPWAPFYALIVLALALLSFQGIKTAHAQSTASVSVNYDAIDALDFYASEATVVIPPDSIQSPKLNPPRGVPRYTPAKVTRASLAPLLCPCAHKLVLRQPAKAKTKARRKKPAEIQHAAITHAPKPEAPADKPVAPIEPTAPKPVAAQPAPKPATPPPAPKVVPPAPPPVKVAVVPPAPEPKPAPSPPAKPPVAVVPTPAPAPPSSAPATTQWSTPSADKSHSQTLTPPPPPRTLAKVEEKTPATPPPVTTPAPAPETKPVDITKSPQVAAIPTAPAPTPGPIVVSYENGGSAVPPESFESVKNVSAKLTSDPTLRVQLLSYATDPEKNVSRARRLSLERAVAVRKVLIDNGLDSTRIEVRALGEQNTGGQPNRVDIVLVTRR